MNIALIGYGKMGKQIEELASAAGHHIVMTIDADNLYEISSDKFKKVDVAIEFTNPDSAVENIKACFKAGIPVVCGTTGWYSSMPLVQKLVDDLQGSLLYASNFSLGVNLFLEINKRAAAIMQKYPVYALHIEETHHIHKKDAPSGTALTLANEILPFFPEKKTIKSILNNEKDSIQHDQLLINSLRIDEEPGTHDMIYTCEEDEILLRHTAFNRAGFAKGAIAAAEWLQGRSGIFTMADVLNFDGEKG